MKLRWEGAVDALARFKEDPTSKMYEDSLQVAYADVAFAVQSGVGTYCNMSTVVSNPSKLTKIYLRKLTKYWHIFMASVELRHWLVQESSDELIFGRSTHV